MTFVCIIRLSHYYVVLTCGWVLERPWSKIAYVILPGMQPVCDKHADGIDICPSRLKEKEKIAKINSLAIVSAFNIRFI